MVRVRTQSTAIAPRIIDGFFGLALDYGTVVRYNVGRRSGGIEQLLEAIDLLAAEDVTTAPQRDVIPVLVAAITRLEADVARRAEAMAHTGEHTVFGYRTVKQYLVARTRCSEQAGYRRTRTARELGQLPATHAAWLSGTISTEHADVIARARHAADADEQFGQFEAALLSVAKTNPPEGLAKVLAQWRDALDNDLDRDGSESRTGELRAARRVSFARSFEGCGLGEFHLDPEGAETVELALDTACDQLHREGDCRSPAQQRADALVAIARAFLAGQSGRANLPNVLVVWSVETMLGRALGDCNLASGARIDRTTAERIACDAFAQHVLVDEDGVPLMLGRASRTFTPDQFRAMVVRDGGCRGLGCHAPPGRCHGHHLRPWRPGGPTDLNNGALFCDACHPDLRERGLQVLGDPNGELRFFDKAGNYLGATHPRGPAPLIPIESDWRGLLIELHAYEPDRDNPAA
jgi:hypothetical protein